MATSSITKNFVISGKKQVETFIDAIESSANDHLANNNISVKQIKGEKELREFMAMRKKVNVN